jgi:hypothetical protein
MEVDFATFCHAGDAHRLHAPGQLRRQVESNDYRFDTIHIVYQNVDPTKWHIEKRHVDYPIFQDVIYDIDWCLQRVGIDIHKKQYTSTTDKDHHWKYHVVNHLVAIESAFVDYIVFADNDCWMVKQPENKSWIERGIELLQDDAAIFIISPNDGESERYTQRFSQQMFLARVDEFRNADFNQPNWNGNVNIPGGPMPEYWAMLEGRMELHCRVTGQYRYVLGPEYRYWHFNRLNKDDLFETDTSKY